MLAVIQRLTPPSTAAQFLAIAFLACTLEMLQIVFLPESPRIQRQYKVLMTIFGPDRGLNIAATVSGIAAAALFALVFACW